MPKRPPKPTDRPSVPRFKRPRNVPFSPFLSPFARIGSLTDLTKDEHLPEAEFAVLEAEIAKGSDRSAAILLGVYAQDALNGMMRSSIPRLDKRTLSDLFGQNGPFYSFYSTILMAHAMELIDDGTKKQLTIIRQVRNAFAHALRPISFRTPEVAEACLSP